MLRWVITSPYETVNRVTASIRKTARVIALATPREMPHPARNTGTPRVGEYNNNILAGGGRTRKKIRSREEKQFINIPDRSRTFRQKNDPHHVEVYPFVRIYFTCT